MEFQKLYKRSVLVFILFVSAVVFICFTVSCNDFKDIKVTREYESMIEVGDTFFVKTKAILSLPSNPKFLKGTKKEFRNLNKKHSLILGSSCYLAEEGYFQVLDLDAYGLGEDEKIKVTFIYKHPGFPSPVIGFCPGGLKGWLYLNEFISKIKQ